MSQPRLAAIILAAGQGTRMKSDLPKVLHEICGRPMLAYVVDACRQAGVRDCYLVVGHRQEMVRASFRDDPDLAYVEQREQKGTGHAVMCCREAVAGKYDQLLVLCGDGPLIRAQTIKQVLDRHRSEGAAATLATSVIENPAGYGRIHRDAAGNLLGIVEDRDCTEEQRLIREVNPSYYCYDADALLTSLQQIRPNNAKGEYYITDTLSILIAAGRKVVAISAVPPQDIFSINSRQDLALVNRVMRDRINDALMTSGVTLVDPDTTWIDARAQIGRDTVIQPFVTISGPAKIGRDCVLGPLLHLKGDVNLVDGTVMQEQSGVVR